MNKVYVVIATDYDNSVVLAAFRDSMQASFFLRDVKEGFIESPYHENSSYHLDIEEVDLDPVFWNDNYFEERDKRHHELFHPFPAEKGKRTFPKF